MENSSASLNSALADVGSGCGPTARPSAENTTNLNLSETSLGIELNCAPTKLDGLKRERSVCRSVPFCYHSHLVSKITLFSGNFLRKIQ